MKALREETTDDFKLHIHRRMKVERRGTREIVLETERGKQMKI